LGDALIAGTAAAQDLAIVTHNVRDFDGLGLDVFNPWQQI
jgi:predicted nucleic acid-binding protein